MNTVIFTSGTKPVIITDDAQAVATILKLGLLNHLTDERHLAASQAGLLFYSFHGHPTHWVLVGCFRGFAKAEDNGYLVKAWDKQFHSSSVMDAEMAAYSDQPHFQSMTDLPKDQVGNN